MPSEDATPKQAAEFLLAAIGSAMRAAQKAAEQQAGGPSELSDSLGAGAEALFSMQEGSEAGGTQCLWYPGPGNGKKLFNYDTNEWGESC